MTPGLDVAAARERCEKAEHLSLRVTQCCDVSIDGAIGAALEFLAHARTDLPLALDRIAELERESRAYRDQRDDNVYEACALIAKNRRLADALKVAREGIENAPSQAEHSEDVADFNTWKSRLLAEIESNLHRGAGSPAAPGAALGRSPNCARIF